MQCRIRWTSATQLSSVPSVSFLSPVFEITDAGGERSLRSIIHQESRKSSSEDRQQVKKTECQFQVLLGFACVSANYDVKPTRTTFLQVHLDVTERLEENDYSYPEILQTRRTVFK